MDGSTCQVLQARYKKACNSKANACLSLSCTHRTCVLNLGLKTRFICANLPTLPPFPHNILYDTDTPIYSS